MDQALAIAEAVTIAGFVASFAQEAYLSRFEGNTAKVLSIATALLIGIVATARTGGFVGVFNAQDTFGTALAIIGSAGIALAASQAAFRVLVKPLNTPTASTSTTMPPPAPPPPSS